MSKFDFVDFDGVSRESILAKYNIVEIRRLKKGDLFMTHANQGSTCGVSMKRDNRQSFILEILKEKE